MKLIFVKPAAGLRLRAPDGTPIPEGGMALPAGDIYVQRRLADGSLLEADEVPQAEPTALAAEEPAPRARKETR